MIQTLYQLILDVVRIVQIDRYTKLRRLRLLLSPLPFPIRRNCTLHHPPHTQIHTLFSLCLFTSSMRDEPYRTRQFEMADERGEGHGRCDGDSEGALETGWEQGVREGAGIQGLVCCEYFRDETRERTDVGGR